MSELERFRRLKMCLFIADFVSKEPWAFKNFGIKENNLFRRHFMREFYCVAERVGEINKVVDFCFG